MKNKNLKESKGITLIALVITIIVLLILAAVSIATLTGENGILIKATQSKEETTKAESEEQVKLAVLGSYDNQGNLDYEELNDNLSKISGLIYNGEKIGGENIIKQLPDKVKVNGYEVGINIDGSVLAKGKVFWYKDENGVITNGKDKLNIGDYINYEPTSETYSSPKGTPLTGELSQEWPNSKAPENLEQGSGYTEEQKFSTNNYTGGWRVLGVDDFTGELLLISADNIKTDAENFYQLRGYTGATYGVQELNNICEIFGNGKGANKARSVTVEDINKITGFDPTNTENGQVYSKRPIS